MSSDRPSLAVVHRSRSGQPAQTGPKVTYRLLLIGRTCPAGQLTVPCSSSRMKSSRVNPPGTAGRSGPGLITCRARRLVVRAGLAGAVVRVTVDLLALAILALRAFLTEPVRAVISTPFSASVLPSPAAIVIWQ